MTNTNVVLDKSHLLAFLVKPTTGFTEHYVSSQPLSLYVPYTEYTSLIKDLITLNLDILRTSLTIYKNAMKFGDDSVQMHKLYHLDIAYAGLEEVRKSYKRGFQCTRIFGLVDCDSNVEVKSVAFEASADFVQENFSQVERQELHKIIQNTCDIPIDVLTPENEELISNVYMYFVCMAYLGVYKFRSDFILTVKEE